MAQDLQNYLSKAINLIAPEKDALVPDFKEIEKVVFSGDGLVTGVEYSTLQLLATNYAGAIPVILSDSDQKRLKALTNGGFTLSRYYQELAKVNLEPANTKEVLEEVSQNKELQDFMFRVNSVELEDGWFTKKQYKLTLQEPEESVADLEITIPADISDDDYYALYNENPNLVYAQAALELYLQSPLTEESKLEAREIFNFLLEKSIKLNASFMRHMGKEMQKNISSAAWPREILAHMVTDQNPKLKGPFVGVQPSQIEKEKLELGWELLPKHVQKSLVESGYQIILVNDDIVKQVGDNTPDLPNAPLFAGITLPDKKKIIIPVNQSPDFLVWTMVHECGHAYHALISEQQGGQYMQGSMHDAVVSNHFNQKTAYQHYDGAPTVYGSTNQNEWFAEMFTIVVMAIAAENGSDIPTYNCGEYAFGIDTLISRAVNRDAKGVHLMSAFVLYGEIYPNKINQIFSWSNVITDELLGLFGGDPNDVNYDLSYKDGLTERERLEYLVGLFNSDNNYLPYQKEVYARIMRAYVNPKDAGSFTAKGSSQDFFNKFFNLLATAPHDPILLQALQSIMLHKVKQGTYGKLEELDGVGADLIDLCNTVYKAHPENPETQKIKALSLMAGEQYQEALALWKELQESADSLSEMLKLNNGFNEYQVDATVGAYLGMVKVMTALCQEKLGHRDLAIQTLETFKDSRGDYYQPAELANLYASEGRFDDLQKLAEDLRSNGDRQLDRKVAADLSIETLEWLESHDLLYWGVPATNARLASR